MPVPLQIHPITSFLGIEEGINGILLPEFYSPDGSDNTYIDQYGRIRKINGYTEINSTAVTTDTGGSSGLWRGLFPYAATEGGSTTNQLIGALDDGVNEWELHYSANGGTSWTFIADLGSSSVGYIPDFAQYRDNLFIVNGKIAPRKWDGSSLTTAGGTQSPTVSASATSTGNLNGNYKWKLVSVEADGTRHPGSAASSTAQLEDEQGSLTWTADSDTDVVGYELYRTTGTGSLYWFVTYIDGRTTAAYTDNAKDATILAQKALTDHGEAPPSGAHFVESHKDRMWYFRTDANPLRGWFSDQALPESVGVDSYVDFTDVDLGSDHIEGAYSGFRGQLVVFTEHSIWTVSGTGAIINGVRDLYRRRSAVQTGTISHRSVVRIPPGAIYRDSAGNLHQTNDTTLAYFTHHGDVRLFDGDADTVISEPLRTIRGQLTYASRHKVHALHDEVNGRIIWFYPFTSSVECNTAMVWDYRRGTWHRWGTQPFSASALVHSTTSSQVLITGSASVGKVFNYFSGDSFNGTAITARWTTNTIYGRLGEDTTGRESALPDISRTKRYRWTDLLMTTDSDVTLTMGVLRPEEPVTATPFVTKTVQPNDTSRGAVQQKVMMKDSKGRYMHDTGFRITVFDSDSNGSWGIEALVIAYQNLPGTRRRN